MTCQEFWNSDPAAGAGHLEECAVCAAAWERHRAVAEGLRLLGDEQRALEAPAWLESRLLAAFRGHTGIGERRTRPAWVPVLTWVTAAAALAMVAVLLVRDREPKPVRRVSPNAVHYAVAPPSPAIPADPEASEIETGDIGGEFIPLPNSVQLAADEEVTLVRLEVPRSAMVALGYQVDDISTVESVSADVMIGPDGVARAVRFLEP